MTNDHMKAIKGEMALRLTLAARLGDIPDAMLQSMLGHLEQLDLRRAPDRHLLNQMMTIADETILASFEDGGKETVTPTPKAQA